MTARGSPRGIYERAVEQSATGDWHDDARPLGSLRLLDSNGVPEFYVVEHLIDQWPEYPVAPFDPGKRIVAQLTILTDRRKGLFLHLPESIVSQITIRNKSDVAIELVDGTAKLENVTASFVDSPPFDVPAGTDKTFSVTNAVSGTAVGGTGGEVR